LEIADVLGIDPGDAKSEEIGAYLRSIAANEVDEEGEEDFRAVSPIEGEEVPEEALAPLLPEDEAPAEKESAFKSGLGSLIASIIPRSSARRIEEDEAGYADDFADLPEPEPSPPAEAAEPAEAGGLD